MCIDHIEHWTEKWKVSSKQRSKGVVYKHAKEDYEVIIKRKSRHSQNRSIHFVYGDENNMFGKWISHMMEKKV